MVYRREMEGVKSIGVMRLSALGDIIWTLPMLYSIQREFPQTQLTLFTDKTFFPLLEDINSFQIVALKKPRSLKDYLTIRKTLKKFQFDIFLCTQASLRANLLYPMVCARRKIGFDPLRGWDMHRLFIGESIPFKKEHSLEAFLGFAKYIGVKNSTLDSSIPLPPHASNWAKEQLSKKKNIIIHPKATALYKTWKVERYSTLINALYDRYPCKIIITGSPEDENFNESIIKSCKVSPKNLTGKTNLKQLAALLKAADLVIAPDSGPIHLADAFGTQAIGLYAATDPFHTGPYQQIENCVNAYPQATQTFLGKEPPSVPWRKRIRAKNVMDLITLEQVLKKIESLQLF